MSSIRNINNKQYDEWKEQSKLKLKEKILTNIQDRIIALETTINNTVKSLISDIQSNNIWTAITYGSNQDLNQYNSIIPTFQVSEAFLHTVTSKLYPLLDKWKGVNAETTQVLPDTFDKYYKKASNYSNTNTSKWLGNHLFYPLLNLVFNEFLPNIVELMYVNDTAQNDITDYQIECEVHTTNELLKLSILKDILHAKIKFERTRDQPIILDQSFLKSKLLKELITEIGNKNGLKWMIPPNKQVP